MISHHIDYNRVSPLAIIIFSIVFVPILFISIASFTNEIIALILVILYLLALIYWLFIREIKYYQLTKNMVYELTESAVVIKSKFFDKKVEHKIQISEIDKIHLVKFTDENKETGTIYLYTNKDIKNYNIDKKERTNQISIERVIDYQSFIKLYKDLRNKNIQACTNTNQPS